MPQQNEVAFFVHQNKGQDADWHKNEQHDAMQHIYAECCIAGANRIAHEVRQCLHNGHPVSIKKLYDIAADIRGRTAYAMQSARPDAACELYGNYAAKNVTDVVTGDYFSGSPAAVIEPLEQTLKKIAGNPAAVHEHFGDGYRVEYEGSGDRNYSITIEQKNPIGDGYFTLLQIGRIPRFVKGALYLEHVHPVDRQKIFAVAERNLKHFLDSQNTDSPKTWKHFNQLYQDLFLAAQVDRGSQTVALMVLAGVMKGAGYELSPIQFEADHFIDTALKTPKMLSDKGMAIFEQPPVKSDLEIPAHVDLDNFFADISARCESLKQQRIHRVSGGRISSPQGPQPPSERY